MTLRFAHKDEIERWDNLLAQNPDGGNAFQSKAIAETKRQNGWVPQYILSDELAITVLEKRVFAHGRYWYIPKGPGVATQQALLYLLPKLQQFAKEHGVFAVKIEPELIETNETHAALQKAGLVQTPAIQPNSSTVLIDLTPDVDDIMARLNQKGRHALRRAERDGVTAGPVELTEQNMRAMFALLNETASGRFETSVRSYAYYREFWQTFANTGGGQLFFARYENKLVAAAYCMYLGKNGIYKDGASIREKTAYGASHLLQWRVIEWMKARGVQRYDLCGAPHSTKINDESHKFYGIGRFKTSFNKQVTDFVGCYDLVVSPAAYKRWQQFGQRLALMLSWRLKKRQWF